RRARSAAPISSRVSPSAASSGASRCASLPMGARRPTRPDSMTSDDQIGADSVQCGRRLREGPYVASSGGHSRVRQDDRRPMTTPKNVSKGSMTPDMMCITDLAGVKLAGERDPSSELKMHLEVYRNRPDVKAVVHAHPPTATGFAVAGIALDRAVLAEVITTLGSIPIAEYATPS